jgi:hypothetical protein
MPVNTIEFFDLEKRLSQTGETPQNVLAPDLGVVYVIAITRDGCSACERQKPQLVDLARCMEENFKDEVDFSWVHVSRPANSDDESLRSKVVLSHYFYPTNLVLLKTRDKGAFEYYRCVSPEMGELEKIIHRAIEVARFLKKDMD